MVKTILILIASMMPYILNAQSNKFVAQELIFENKGIENQYLTNTYKCNIKIDFTDKQIVINKDKTYCWTVLNKQQVGNSILYLAQDSSDASNRVIFVSYSNKVIIIDDKITITYLSK